MAGRQADQPFRAACTGLTPAAPQFVCTVFFGPPRQTGGSHAVFKTPWQGDPRLNLQRGPGGQAKAYQVRQVLDALDRLKEDA
jgi:hypothetical protein